MERHLLFLIWLCACAKGFAIGPYSSGDKLYVWAYHGLSLRSAPNPKAARLTTIPYGQALTVLDSVRVKAFTVEEIPGFTLKGFWSKVRYGTEEGWVFDGYLSKYPAMHFINIQGGQELEDFRTYALREFGPEKKQKRDLETNKVCQDCPRYRERHTFRNGVAFENVFLDMEVGWYSFYCEIPNLSFEEAFLAFVSNQYMPSLGDDPKKKNGRIVEELGFEVPERSVQKMSIKIDACEYEFRKKGNTTQISIFCSC